MRPKNEVLNRAIVILRRIDDKMFTWRNLQQIFGIKYTSIAEKFHREDPLYDNNFQPIDDKSVREKK